MVIMLSHFGRFSKMYHRSKELEYHTLQLCACIKHHLPLITVQLLDYTESPTCISCLFLLEAIDQLLQLSDGHRKLYVWSAVGGRHLDVVWVGDYKQPVFLVDAGDTCCRQEFN